jgi:flavin-binding protein dodecin
MREIGLVGTSKESMGAAEAAAIDAAVQQASEGLKFDFKITTMYQDDDGTFHVSISVIIYEEADLSEEEIIALKGLPSKKLEDAVEEAIERFKAKHNDIIDIFDRNSFNNDAFKDYALTVLAAAPNLDENDVVDTIMSDELAMREAAKEEKELLTVSENDIGEMEPEPAPEIEDELKPTEAEKEKENLEKQAKKNDNGGPKPDSSVVEPEPEVA